MRFLFWVQAASLIRSGSFGLLSPRNRCHGHHVGFHSIGTLSWSLIARFPPLDVRTIQVTERGILIGDSFPGNKVVPSWLASNVVADCFIALAAIMALRRQRTGFKRYTAPYTIHVYGAGTTTEFW